MEYSALTTILRITAGYDAVKGLPGQFRVQMRDILILALFKNSSAGPEWR
jgi:hypothetical protein